MKARKILVILLFPLMTDVFVACCHCFESQRKYSIDGLRLINLDNSGPNIIEAKTGQVVKTAYGIRAIIPTMLVYNQLQQPRPFFIQSAYAVSKCGCGSDSLYSPQEKIDSLKVFTVYDFDATHPASSEVSGYFKIYENYNYSSIAEYIAGPSTIFGKNSDRAIKLNLLLMQPPAINTGHRFKVEIYLSDGRSFTETTTLTNLI